MFGPCPPALEVLLVVFTENFRAFGSVADTQSRHVF